MSYFLRSNDGVAIGINNSTLYIYKYDENFGPLRILELEFEPFQVQEQLNCDCIVLSDMVGGLKCFSISDWKLRWKAESLKGASKIIYNCHNGWYYITLQDRFGSIIFDNNGYELESLKFRVNGIFYNGKCLFVENSRSNWEIVESDSLKTIYDGGKLRATARCITGNEEFFGFSSTRGCFSVYSLLTCNEVYSLEARNWFSITEVINYGSNSRFRMLVSDWNKLPMGAVIDVDGSIRDINYIAEKREWNFSAVFANGGKGVLRFFPNREIKFEVTPFPSS